MNIEDNYNKRHALALQLAEGLASKVLKISSKAESQIVSSLRDFIDNASDKDIALLQRGVTGRYDKNSLAGQLMRDIDEIINNSITAIKLFTTKEFTEFADDDISEKAVIMAVDKDDLPKTEDVLSKPIGGYSKDGLWDDYKGIWKKKVKQSIIQSINESTDPILTLKGTKSQEYKDGLFNQIRNSLERSTKTQLSGVANNVNSEIIKKTGYTHEVHVATLDRKSCAVCGSLDGYRHKAGEGRMPPIHPNCRCFRMPWRNKRDQPKKYPDWLKRQSDKTKKAILGSYKFKLYKTGKVDIREFFPKDNVIPSVASLKKRYGEIKDD